MAGHILRIGSGTLDHASNSLGTDAASALCLTRAVGSIILSERPSHGSERARANRPGPTATPGGVPHTLGITGACLMSEIGIIEAMSKAAGVRFRKVNGPTFFASIREGFENFDFLGLTERFTTLGFDTAESYYEADEAGHVVALWVGGMGGPVRSALADIRSLPHLTLLTLAAGGATDKALVQAISELPNL